MDAVTAFLNADMGEEIFLSMDEETASILREASSTLEDKSLHLSDSRYKLAVKALYGVPVAPKRWWLELKAYLLSIGFENISVDPCLFRRGATTSALLYVITWVDDHVITGPSPDAIAKFKKELSEKYEMKDLVLIDRFLGISVYRDSDSLSLTQEANFTEILHRYQMFDSKAAPIPAEEGHTLSMSEKRGK